MICRYFEENGKVPCCTHSCTGCMWNEESDPVSIYDLIRESIENADGNVALIHVDVLREILRIFDGVYTVSEQLKALQRAGCDE